MRKLRDEMATSDSNGESSFTIKFFKGTPKIVPLSYKNQVDSQFF